MNELNIYNFVVYVNEVNQIIYLPYELEVDKDPEGNNRYLASVTVPERCFIVCIVVRNKKIDVSNFTLTDVYKNDYGFLSAKEVFLYMQPFNFENYIHLQKKDYYPNQREIFFDLVEEQIKGLPPVAPLE